ncbi:hypothetical protein [Flavobacterium sp.]|uniref:hypothetical protein n=1 Tax=Flavobacterium sp. TaxID=239 RepID=UPI002488EDF6|nr:hypothetical protein [Flavobacterium sp.]MDI1317947.1 hypothetical protein [Flavobacterium sp.]
MKIAKSCYFTSTNKTVFLFLFLLSLASSAQENPLPKAKTGAFWEKVQFGGGLGLGIGNDFTNILVAPSAIYNFNDYFAFGTGVQYSYLKQKNFYSSNVFGGSLIGLFSPIDVVQLSLELEEVSVNNTYTDLGGNFKDSFWNTNLYIGAGYRDGNVTIGGRVNVLFDKDKDIYGSAFMPFVRVFF